MPSHTYLSFVQLLKLASIRLLWFNLAALMPSLRAVLAKL